LEQGHHDAGRGAVEHGVDEPPEDLVLDFLLPARIDMVNAPTLDDRFRPSSSSASLTRFSVPPPPIDRRGDDRTGPLFPPGRA
jgi:hypothetical protein